jgi:hypothetical protein
MLDYDPDYSEHARRFIAEVRQRQEDNDKKKKRRMLWLGKFAFPKVNTKKTKLLFVPPGYHRHYIPVMEPLRIGDFRADNPSYDAPNRDVVDLNKWGYNGKRLRAVIRFGYYEKDDVLIVCPESFVYQQRHSLSDGSDWYIDEK